MRIEQRIGRVDRIGQKHPVKAFNLIFEDSVELRVQEVLEEKLATILEEFGVDKTQDVLDSAESGAVFEKLYAQAILNPGDIEKNIERLIQEVRGQAGAGAVGRSLYGGPPLDPTLAQQLSSHPLPYWVERMTTAYLRAEGGKIRRDLFGYSLEWPDGSRMDRVSFHAGRRRTVAWPTSAWRTSGSVGWSATCPGSSQASPSLACGSGKCHLKWSVTGRCGRSASTTGTCAIRGCCPCSSTTTAACCCRRRVRSGTPCGRPAGRRGRGRGRRIGCRLRETAGGSRAPRPFGLRGPAHQTPAAAPA